MFMNTLSYIHTICVEIIKVYFIIVLNNLKTAGIILNKIFLSTIVLFNL